jgi:hypothetical protein
VLAIGIAERCAQDTTTETKVVRSYLIALAIADVGHVFITCFVMGYERAIDIAQWNAMAWGNIGVTVSSRPCPWRAQVQLTWCLYPGTAFPVPFGIFTGPVWIRPTITFCEDGKEAIVITLTENFALSASCFSYGPPSATANQSRVSSFWLDH